MSRVRFRRPRFLVVFGAVAMLALAGTASVVSAGPSADNFPGQPLPRFPFSLTVSNATATLQRDEPYTCTTTKSLDPDQDLPFTSQFGATLWFEYYATQTQTVRIDTNGSTTALPGDDPDGDTIIVVYTPGRSARFSALRQLTCGDDINDVYGDLDVYPRGGTMYNSEVTFRAERGQTYYIQVGGWQEDDQPTTAERGTIKLNGKVVSNVTSGGSSPERR